MSKENTKYPKTVVVPIEARTHDALRDISYTTRLSMSHLVRMGIEKVLDKYKNVVDLKL